MLVSTHRSTFETQRTIKLVVLTIFVSCLFGCRSRSAVDRSALKSEADTPNTASRIVSCGATCDANSGDFDAAACKSCSCFEKIGWLPPQGSYDCKDHGVKVYRVEKGEKKQLVYPFKYEPGTIPFDPAHPPRNCLNPSNNSSGRCSPMNQQGNIVGTVKHNLFENSDRSNPDHPANGDTVHAKFFCQSSEAKLANGRNPNAMFDGLIVYNLRTGAGCWWGNKNGSGDPNLPAGREYDSTELPAVSVIAGDEAIYDYHYGLHAGAELGPVFRYKGQPVRFSEWFEKNYAPQGGNCGGACHYTDPFIYDPHFIGTYGNVDIVADDGTIRRTQGTFDLSRETDWSGFLVRDVDVTSVDAPLPPPSIRDIASPRATWNPALAGPNETALSVSALRGAANVCTQCHKVYPNSMHGGGANADWSMGLDLRTQQQWDTKNSRGVFEGDFAGVSDELFAELEAQFHTFMPSKSAAFHGGRTIKDLKPEYKKVLFTCYGFTRQALGLPLEGDVAPLGMSIDCGVRPEGAAN